mmetsp:Transcript_130771/g.406653  ORF Transcript_130771/g.406653 Transcript_130771/m.406653 type:complete len:104 (+) Transcript_130771:69-380(+)
MSWDKWLKTIAPDLVRGSEGGGSGGEEEEVPAFTPSFAIEEAHGILAPSSGKLSTVVVDLGGGVTEEVQVDSKRGPKVMLKGGGSTFTVCSVVPWHAQRRSTH